MLKQKIPKGGCAIVWDAEWMQKFDAVSECLLHLARVDIVAKLDLY